MLTRGTTLSLVGALALSALVVLSCGRESELDTAQTPDQSGLPTDSSGLRAELSTYFALYEGCLPFAVAAPDYLPSGTDREPHLFALDNCTRLWFWFIPLENRAIPLEQ